jgi:AraC-like DNA-binding protein
MKVEQETFRILNEVLSDLHDAENRVINLLKTLANNSGINSNDKRFQRGIQSRRVAKNIEKYRDRIIELHAEGLSNEQIAAKVGLHRSTVRMYARVLGMEPNPRKSPSAVLPPGRTNAPTYREQNEHLRQNPWETENDN